MRDLQWFLLLAPVAAVFCLAAFVVSVMERPRKILFLSHYLLGCFLILTGQLLELTSPEPDIILLFSRGTYLVLAFQPVFWFLFAQELTGGGRSPRFRPLALVLGVVPLVTAVIAFTNPLHHWLWEENRFQTVGAFTVNVVVRYGPWFWVHCAYSYGLYLVGFFLIAREFSRHHRLYRVQALWVLVGSLLPLGFNLIYVFRLFGPMVKDFSALVLALSGLCFTVGIRRYALDRVRPLPRHGLYEWIEDAVLILDAQKRVVDLNRAATDRLPFPAAQLLGQPLAHWLPSLGNDFPAPGDLVQARPVAWFQGHRTRAGEVRVRPLMRHRQGPPVGYSVTVFEQTPASSDPAAPVPALADTLSRKEGQVLALVVQGLTNKEIAQRLHISESTVKSHVHSLLAKAGVTRRGDLKAEAFESSAG